jgi:hypothetical protein
MTDVTPDLSFKTAAFLMAFGVSVVLGAILILAEWVLARLKVSGDSKLAASKGPFSPWKVDGLALGMSGLFMIFIGVVGPMSQGSLLYGYLVGLGLGVFLSSIAVSIINRARQGARPE